MGERIREIVRWVLGLGRVDSGERAADDPGGVADRELDGLDPFTAWSSVPSGSPAQLDSLALPAWPVVPPRAGPSRPGPVALSPIDEVPDHRAWNYRGWKRLALELFSGRARAGLLVEGTCCWQSSGCAPFRQD
jgi:hypothetical protein